MTSSLPPQRPEGKLLQSALTADGRSIRQIASSAGISEARWRQIIKGSMTMSGHMTEVISPPATLARMAYALNVTPKQLRAAGRDDAALLLEHLLKDAQRGTSVVPLPATGGTGGAADEIDLIYASRSMTDREKLVAIRQVLQLRARVEAESQGPSPAQATGGDRQRDEAR